VWEVQPDLDFECLSVLMEHSQDVKCVAWHPSEEILASASYDNDIKLYVDDPADDWYTFSTLRGHESSVWSVAFSPCGNYLASCSEDSNIFIWRPLETSGNHGSWERVHVIKGDNMPVYSISWCRVPGCVGWLASGGGEGTIYIWSIHAEQNNSRRVSSVLVASIPSAHQGLDINSVAWCPTSSASPLLATAGDDGNVKVWCIEHNI